MYKIISYALYNNACFKKTQYLPMSTIRCANSLYFYCFCVNVQCDLKPCASFVCLGFTSVHCSFSIAMSSMSRSPELTICHVLYMCSAYRESVLCGPEPCSHQLPVPVLYMCSAYRKHGGTWSNRTYVALALFSLLATCVVF
jgi:hypothetical protein